MPLADWLPPSDLLEKVRGIEDGLRQTRRVGRIGWIGLITASAVDIALELRDFGIIKILLSGNLDKLLNWKVGLLAVAVFSLLLTGWSRFWLKESKRPFRYVCSIGAFVWAGPEGEKSLADTAMAWLPGDLARLLNERVKRFLFCDEAAGAPATEADSIDASIHVRGRYLLRTGSQGLEITPSIRIGPRGRPEVLATTTPPVQLGDSLDRSTYERMVLERVYNSVVTEIYRQLKEDVDRKIELLPTRRFRALALINEADDYARSNSLHALSEARELYARAATMLDPTVSRESSTGVIRVLWTARCVAAAVASWCRAKASRLVPRLGEREVLYARALTGWANMVVFRTTLAPIVGLRPQAVFEARPLALRALERLRRLDGNVAGRGEGLFEAEVAFALASIFGEDPRAGCAALDRAVAEDHARAEAHAMYLFARSQVTPGAAQLDLLRRAVEIAPRFEVARHQLAFGMEREWHTRTPLERTSAKYVIEEYLKLLQVNPNNLGAWANAGYLSWLIGDCEAAKAYFQDGRSYKAIQPDSLVAELDYGLARIYAETGDLDRAHRHYREAVASMLGYDGPGDFKSYYFEDAMAPTVERFAKYFARFAKQVRRPHDRPRDDDYWHVRRAVHAFVLNDLGDASAKLAPERACWAYRSAILADPSFAPAHFNLGFSRHPQEIAPMRRAVELQPSWTAARLNLAQTLAATRPKLQDQVRLRERKRRELAELQNEYDRRRKAAARLNQAATPKAAASASVTLSNLPSVLEHRSIGDAGERVSVSAARGSIPHGHEAQATAPAASGAALRSNAELSRAIAAIQGDLSSIESKIGDLERVAAEHIEDMLQTVRPILPLAEFWKTGELDESVLWSNRAWWRRRPRLPVLYWERRLNSNQVSVLWLWALKLARDEGEAARAGRILEALRDTFWPGSENLNSEWFGVQHKLAQKAGLSAAAHKAELRLCARRILAANPLLVLNLKRRGALAELEFRHSELIGFYEQALRMVSTNDVWTGLRKGLAELQIARLDDKDFAGDRIALCREAVEADPENAGWRARLADLLAAEAHDKGTLDAAIGAAERAVRSAPRDAEAMLRLRNLRLRQREMARRRSGKTDVLTAVPALIVEYGPELASVVEPPAGSAANTHVSEMLNSLRDGLWGDLGVRFPRVVLRPSSDPPHPAAYVILLHGLPVVGGVLGEDLHLVQGEVGDLRKLGLDAREAINPANGRTAAWIPASQMPRFKELQPDIPDWNRFDCIVLHLAAVMRKHAAELLRLDCVVAHLTEANLEQELAELERKRCLAEFAGVLRALVAEEFSIRRLADIVHTFQASYRPGRSLVEVTEEIRRHAPLRRTNRVMRPPTVFVRIGTQIEDAIEAGLREGDERVLALSPELTQDILNTVRTRVSALGEDDPNFALLTVPRLRPWVRKLVELEFPHLAVVSEAEALPEGIARVKEWLDLPPPRAPGGAKVHAAKADERPGATP
jgi:tetratricopeptide (TPR) repeat protein